MSARITLKNMWESEFKDKLSYNTFKKYVEESLDAFKDVMIVKQNAQRKTYRILDKEQFVKTFKDLY